MVKKVEVFSFGGCGTNFLRGILMVKAPKQQDLLTPQQRNMCIRTRVHQRRPPVDGYDLVVYVYGDPIKSIDSMLFRKQHRTLNILAKQNLVHESNTVEQNADALFKENPNVLQLEEHFDNWTTCSSRPYDIVLVNYDALDHKNYDLLCKAIQRRGVEINNLAKCRFKPRQREPRNFMKPHLAALTAAHKDLISKMSERPVFELKCGNGPPRPSPP